MKAKGKELRGTRDKWEEGRDGERKAEVTVH